MPATPDPPTWQILPVAGGHFQWIPAAGAAVSRAEEPSGTLAAGDQGGPDCRLPSMADLLLKASPKLLEGGGGGGGDGGVPMFRTGSGRSVSLRQSSIQKAMSVLEGGDGSERGGLSVGNGGTGEGDLPMFRTGSGKSVTVKQSSIRKAAAVLEGENVQRESLKPPKVNCQSYGAPMFHAGSGNSILLKQSSIKKAMSLLQDGENMEIDNSLKNTVHANFNFSNSLFQTGSGKTVNISSAGLTRATTLLGLGASNNLSFEECFEHTMGQCNTNIGTTSENLHDKVRWDANCGTACAFNMDKFDIRSVTNSLTCSRNLYPSGNNSCIDAFKKPMGSEVCTSDFAQHPVELQTGGGRYISISSGSLQRAKSLLGGPDLAIQCNDAKVDKSQPTVDERTFDETSWNKENLLFACMQTNAGTGTHMTKTLPLTPSSSRHSDPSLAVAGFQGIVPNQVNAKCVVSEGNQVPTGYILDKQKLSSKGLYATTASVHILRKIPDCRPFREPLADVSNSNGTNYVNTNRLICEKRRLGGRSSISPFKRPRTSRFTSPLESKFFLHSSGPSLPSTSENCCCRTRVSSRYPFQLKRKTIRNFFGGPPCHHDRLQCLPDEVKRMNADSAEKYRFHNASGEGIGPDVFRDMLLQSGASILNATKEWVANHYKWIVWKLACLERCHPTQAHGTYLTVSNVLEELKYRYEREINYGHRSAIKRILDGDASPGSMIVLCVSAIRSYSDLGISKVEDITDQYEEKKGLGISNGPEHNRSSKIELTDGWYSLDAYLDVLLSKQLAVGKLFIGQKLRIWGASLCSWVGPVSALEASKAVSLLIHINGTYRVHWADPLGKGIGAPLAFRCIKGAGGEVPWTLVGLTRIYPILYKETFPDGASIVRSERMEKKALQLYNQRQYNIAEDIMSKPHGDYVNDDDSEGAKIFRILETAAEPEVLMADLSSEQLISISNYQAKQEVIRQSSMKKKIEKALQEAGLSVREVTPFIRVRVVGLTKKGSSRKCHPRQGLITIWNPSDEQIVDLVEGQIYSVARLMPQNFGSDVMYLQGRGSSMLWKSMPSSEFENFEPFFTPRRSIPLSNLGEVPLASEFDIAAVIVHVGEVYLCGRQKKQWVFVTDGSNCHSELQCEEPYNCLLAVSFCSAIMDDESSPPLSHTLSGTTVAFCNLVKRARDEMNHLWVAEATEISTYFVCHNVPSISYFKEAAVSAQKWAKVSCLTIQKLRERVSCIIGGHGI